MANARTETETVTTTRVFLELSPEEAQFLIELSSRVGGERTGLRGHADSIVEALLAEGFDNFPDRERMTGVVQVF